MVVDAWGRPFPHWPSSMDHTHGFGQHDRSVPTVPLILIPLILIPILVLMLILILILIMFVARLRVSKSRARRAMANPHQKHPGPIRAATNLKRSLCIDSPQ